VWTQPADWEFDAQQPAAGLMPDETDGWSVALCDGSVRYLLKTLNSKILRRLVQASDGEPLEDF
jgi:hypothetical protein